MQELIQRLVDRAGISEEQAGRAVDTVVAYVKEHAPAPVASQLETLLTSEQGEAALGAAKSAIGGMFAKRDSE